MKLEQLALVFFKLHAIVERHGNSNTTSSIGRENKSDKWASQSALPRAWEGREMHACREMQSVRLIGILHSVVLWPIHPWTTSDLQVPRSKKEINAMCNVGLPVN